MNAANNYLFGFGCCKGVQGVTIFSYLIVKFIQTDTALKFLLNISHPCSYVIVKSLPDVISSLCRLLP